MVFSRSKYLAFPPLHNLKIQFFFVHFIFYNNTTQIIAIYFSFYSLFVYLLIIFKFYV